VKLGFAGGAGKIGNRVVDGIQTLLLIPDGKYWNDPQIVSRVHSYWYLDADALACICSQSALITHFTFYSSWWVVGGRCN